ncbi:MAG: hypothetical protein Q8M03_12465 [Legionella sp.]|nr:hypothetical protein [Legionella sp.]
MNQLLKVSVFFLFAASINAADLPVEDPQNQCITGNTDDCIKSVCPTSSVPDCSAQCKAAAEEKCKELSSQG